MDMPQTVSTTVETVTPEIARAWLMTQHINRKLSPGTVQSYARVMRDRQWALNGEAIIFDEHDHLVNGQHRLHAVIEANVDVKFVIVRGVSSTAQSTMDDPRRRTALDQVRLQDASTPSQAVAAARWLVRLRLSSIGQARRTTNVEVNTMLARHVMLVNSAKVCAMRQEVLAPSILTCFHYIGSELLALPERATAMVKVLETGLPDYDGCAMHAWREMLLKAKSHGGVGLSQRDQFDGTSHAWNLFAVRKAAPKKFKIPDEVTIEGLKISAL